MGTRKAYLKLTHTHTHGDDSYKTEATKLTMSLVTDLLDRW